MPRAYVLINCELGYEDEIIKELKTIPGVAKVSAVYGVYDMIVEVKSDTLKKLRETITWHFRRIDKIKTTVTMIVIEA
jgi:DNA-binding Lrp family transcriptional regulator